MSNKPQNIIEYNADYRDKNKHTVKSTPISNTTTPQHFHKKDSISKAQQPKPNNYINEQTKAKNSKKSEKEVTIIANPESEIGCIKESTITKKQLGFYRLILAGITMILSVTGIIILLSTMNRTTSVMNDSLTFTKYNHFIAPVVMQNPSTFNEGEKADINMVISASIWRLLLQNGIDKYKEFDEQGFTLIPVTDIQNSCTDLFGPTYKISTQENIYGSFYSYTPNEQNFHIGAISNLDTHIPHTEEITEENDDLILTVSYLSRDDENLDSDKNKSNTPTPVKRMKYRLRINQETQKYYIYAIDNI